MSSLNTCVGPMLQEFNYYTTKCYCTCSFILGREMFWKRRCILQRKAFNIQSLIGDNQKQQRIRKNWSIHRDGPSEIRGGFIWFLNQQLNTPCKGLHFPVCPPLWCWKIWLKIIHVLWHKTSFFSPLPDQTTAVFVVLFLFALCKAEDPLIQQAGTQMSHPYSKTKNVHLVARCM